MATTHLSYRPEIDGLRAIAVIPVILFHAGIPLAQGGYLGVDIFFVISGFLITSIILSELNKGSFSIVRFYERRARRILPALFTILFACTVLAECWFLPDDKTVFYESLVSVPLFASNFLFWQQTGYWEVENELKPLLHTWSLAIEEQYYVLIPLLMLWLYRPGQQKRFVYVFVTILIASLTIAELNVTSAPTFNFFMLTSRAWELAAGGLVAVFLFHQESQPTLSTPTLTQNLISLVAFLMLLIPMMSYSYGTPHPGLYTVWPVLGTCLLIVTCTRRTLVGRFLTLRPVIGTGLISYSLYLWHQPVLSFYKYKTGNQLDGDELLFLGALTVTLSIVSWRFIERPFRTRGKYSRKQIALFSIVGSLAFISWGVSGLVSDMKSDPLSPEKLAQTNTLRANYGLSFTCDDSFTLSPACRTGEEPDILVWGDSYAMHLVNGIVSSKPDVQLIQMTLSGCAPILGLAQIDLSSKSLEWSQGCIDFNNEVLDWLKKQEKPIHVVISTPLTRYLKPELSLLNSKGESIQGGIALVKSAFLNTAQQVERLGHKLVFISPPPSTGEDIGRCLAQQSSLALDACNFQLKDSSLSRRRMYELIGGVEEQVSVINLHDHLCPDGSCMTHFDGVFLYRDQGHLSVNGSKLLGEHIDLYGLIQRSGKNKPNE